uniref:Myb/SANT-like domain-containing protein n=1 Tax=Oryza brachyantha TaxID=4533 RepID=J3L5X5_ORYBR
MDPSEDELNGANNAEWTDENTRIVCELFAFEVRDGKRPSTHLNKDLPGCLKFKLRGLQNEHLLQEIFEDPRNTGNDHWNPARGDLPESSSQPPPTINVNDIEEVNGVDNDDSGDEDFTPPAKRAKRARGKEVKKPKTSGGNWFYEQMTRFVDNQEKTAATVESFVRREDTSGCAIKDVMALVKECGVIFGTNEHFIATEIFTKKSEREMFMTLDNAEERLAWLKMKHEAKLEK